MEFPLQHRAKLHSTNPLERLNGEIKRRNEIVGIFRSNPSRRTSLSMLAVLPLLYAPIIILDHRYF